MNYNMDILIAGVGGQGTVLASRLLASAAMARGWQARTSETIGMAQRGGSVTSHVRIGESKKSPLIPSRKASLLIGLEPAEAARNLPKLALGGKCVVYDKPIQSVLSAIDGSYNDIEEILAYVNTYAAETIIVDSIKNNDSNKTTKTLNLFLIGVAVAAGFLPFTKEEMIQTIEANLPEQYIEMNIEAFNNGFESKNRRLSKRSDQYE